MTVGTEAMSSSTTLDFDNPLVVEVWKKLDLVCDPELDEPITDMGFIEGIEIGTDKAVAISFRLPTYWCSANFAFLMATDIRLEVEQMEWVSGVRVQLHDHMFEEQVNTGVNEGHSFRKIFADLAPGQGLDEIREKFRKKAFQRRQEVTLLGLRSLGLSDEQIVSMTLAEFDKIDFSDQSEQRQKNRYRDIAKRLGIATNPGDLAFREYGGAALEPDDLGEYLSLLRGVRINMEFSGALCRGLLSTRYKELNRDDDDLTLVDFLPEPPARETGISRQD